MAFFKNLKDKAKEHIENVKSNVSRQDALDLVTDCMKDYAKGGDENKMKAGSKLLMGLGLLLLTASSCNVSREAASNLALQQTNVVLSRSNYRVIGQVEGKSKQFYFLGFGGISKNALEQNALSDMYDEAFEYSKGRSTAVINVSVGYKTGIYLICGERRAYARGTLIEFYEDQNSVATANALAAASVKTIPSAKDELPKAIRQIQESENEKVVYVQPQAEIRDKYYRVEFKDGTVAYVKALNLESGYDRSRDIMFEVYKITKLDGSKVSVDAINVKNVKKIMLTDKELDEILKK